MVTELEKKYYKKRQEAKLFESNPENREKI